MKTFLRGWCLFFVFIIHWNCSNSQKKAVIVRLPMLNYIDTSLDRGKQVIYKGDYYIVKNYKESKAMEELIDSFVEQNKDTQIQKYTQYRLTFFKESSKTNLSNIMTNPRIIDRYSNDNDRIYEYHWSNGKFLSRWKIKNGEILEPKNDIIIEDIPDSASIKRE